LFNGTEINMNSKMKIFIIILAIFSLSSIAVASPASVETNEPFRVLAGPPCGTPVNPCDGGGGTGQTIPWGITRVNADTAQNNVDETGIIVAIVDTGLDVTHEDLQGLFVWGWSYYDGNREISGGVECTTADPSPCADGHGHGTHVTGTVAAQNNDLGVLGVAPDISIYTLKALSDRGSGTAAAVAGAIIKATEGPDGVAGTSDDADVISMSLGSSSSSSEIESAVKFAYANGVVLVAATGNDGADSPSYPAAYPEVLAVGAIDKDNNIASWSNRGEDVFAPGVDILSTLPGNNYDSWSGTSMATPHVSGVAALAIAAHPTYSNSQIVDLIISTTDSYNVVDASAVV
jgi:subtilisin family serine protease